MKVDEQEFSEMLQKKLGSHWERALKVFKMYSPNMTYDVTNMMLHAVDKDKVVEVVEILEEHYKKHLNYQHPDACGIINPAPTRAMFLNLCENVLKLKPN